MQQQILARFGKEFTWELKAKMMGRKALHAAEILIEDLGLQGQLTAEAFIEEREALLHELFPSSQLMPGAERLLRHLTRHKVPTCVATSSHRRHFELKTQRHSQIFALFDHIVTGDQVTVGKPDPMIFQRAAAAWSSAPDSASCLVFEDAPSGVAAAVAAGMACVMVPDANLARDATLAATQVLGSLEHFKPELYGLPPFDDV